MSSNRSYTWPVISVVIALCLVLVALPNSAKQWAPGFLRAPSLHFGLDLAGGTQLDFRISEKEMQEQVASLEKEIADAERQGVSGDKLTILQNQLYSIEQQQANVVESIRTVLERRINALGVSEAVITPSYIGNEKHLLVECPGVVDTQQCIDTVGKTIQLEFKEELTEPSDEYESEVRARIAETVERLNDPENSLAKLGEDLGSEIGISFTDNTLFFDDMIPQGLEGVWSKTPASGILQYDGVVEVGGTDHNGQPTSTDVPGVFLVEVLSPKTQTGRVVNNAERAFTIIGTQEADVEHITHTDAEFFQTQIGGKAQALREMDPGNLADVKKEDGTASILFLRRYDRGQITMEGSHILVAYKGASAASEDITRSKKEAKELAAELAQKLSDGEDFTTLARTHSDGPSGKDGGSLGEFSKTEMVPAFASTAFALAEGDVSSIVETQFGFHIIRSDSAPKQQPDLVSYEELLVTGEEASDRATTLLHALQKGEVEAMEDAIRLRTLFFSLLPTGWGDTLLDGKHFRAATVTLDPSSNRPIVQISFDDEGARLFQELTKNNVGKSLAIFVGGQLISAPTVQQEIIGGIAVITGSRTFDEASELANDLNTGAIPAPIYLAGQRTVEATLGAKALETSLQAALLGVLILMVYMIVMYRLLGLLADVALSVYALIFFALLKLPLFLFSSNYIVLTLAGMAGIILSIGMAVDANVLIFERMKEELRKGKMLKTAADTGFSRAWPSIRDGNFSTFITCAILFMIGTSIVRGFAITLGTGVLISMFSAIVVTRWLVRAIAQTALAEKTWLFGVRARSREDVNNPNV